MEMEYHDVQHLHKHFDEISSFIEYINKVTTFTQTS
jgi:hypothetical protein